MYRCDAWKMSKSKPYIQWKNVFMFPSYFIIVPSCPSWCFQEASGTLEVDHLTQFLLKFSQNFLLIFQWWKKTKNRSVQNMCCCYSSITSWWNVKTWVDRLAGKVSSTNIDCSRRTVWKAESQNKTEMS